MPGLLVSGALEIAAGAWWNILVEGLKILSSGDTHRHIPRRSPVRTEIPCGWVTKRNQRDTVWDAFGIVQYRAGKLE